MGAPIRTLRDDEVRARSHELVDLQSAAYRIEAELIGDDRIPPLNEDAAGLVASGLTWLVAEHDGDREVLDGLWISGYRHP